MFNLGTLQKVLLKPTIPVIKISGVIDIDQYPVPSLSSNLKYFWRTAKVAQSLKRVNTARAKALAVVVNSPGHPQFSFIGSICSVLGGSPAQSEIICHKIKHFCHEHRLPLYTFAEDVAASGGYFILCIGKSLIKSARNVTTSFHWIQAIKFLWTQVLLSAASESSVSPQGLRRH